MRFVTVTELKQRATQLVSQIQASGVIRHLAGGEVDHPETRGMNRLLHAVGWIVICRWNQR